MTAMILLLVRHGIAEDIDDSEGSDDASRQLTQKGRRRARQLGRFLAEKGLKPTLAVSSTRTRAIQTAEIVLEELASSEPIRMVEAMDLEGRWPALRRSLRELLADQKNAVVLAVGHLPSIGIFFSEAAGFGSPHDDFRKGAVAAFEWDDNGMEGPGNLLFYMTARFL
jgi:phosphohistidine phosphatase